MKYYLILFIIFFIACNSSKNVEIPNLEEGTSAQFLGNEELIQMRKADQEDRILGCTPEVSRRDSLRQIRLYELLDSNLIKTANDHYAAGLLFHHGGDTSANLMAIKMLEKAFEMDTSMGKQKWLLAAATDRYLLNKGKAQIYGTQYSRDMKGNRILMDIDTTQVTDAERKEYGVSTLAEIYERLKWRNKKQLFTLYIDGIPIDEIIALCKQECMVDGTYNVTNRSINKFAYQLEKDGEDDVALKVLALNTELFPDEYKTHENLGYHFLKMGQRKEGIAAYKKSLELKPDNKYIIQALKDIGVE